MKSRYQSQLNLPEIGVSGQKTLESAKIFVVGAGGLGCPTLLHLVSLGVGTIGFADFDKIALENLNRQVLYSESDVGLYKAEIAAQVLRQRNNSVTIKEHNAKLDSTNAKMILSNYDLILDCSDNYEARYVIDEACHELSKPWIYAAVGGFEGQISVFNHRIGYRFSDLFADKTIFEKVQSCNELGIISPTCAYASVLQTTEAIKIILDLDDLQEGKLLCFNLLNQKCKTFNIRKSL